MHFHYHSFIDSSCTKLALVSSGKASRLHSNNLGTYVKESRMLNGRSVYRHRDDSYFLYWINEFGGNWMVSRYLRNYPSYSILLYMLYQYRVTNVCTYIIFFDIRSDGMQD